MLAWGIAAGSMGVCFSASLGLWLGDQADNCGPPMGPLCFDLGLTNRMTPAGTTVTIVLVTGCLLTSANIGDSAAVLDTGCSMLELTDSHRIQVRFGLARVWVR